MQNFKKYQKNYFAPQGIYNKWSEKDCIAKAPIWCSVDLRDGNQALVVPMDLEQKLEFFKMLTDVGFKEIEIGFPAASKTEYDFLRTLVQKNLIPEDVTIQVLTQSRKHIIEKTFEALKGVKKAIIHLYNSTSVAQREQVFKKNKNEIIDIALKGTRLIKDMMKAHDGDLKFEYSPESFTGTEMNFAKDICNAVIDEWQPTANNKMIINLPITVSLSSSHIFASQVEYMIENLNNRENVIVSIHPHNDRGCAVSDSELGLLAGAQRVEGTLFGNGERTGNVDIIILALNMFSQGVNPNLNFSNIPRLIHVYEQITGMKVYERQPYSGELVFTAFSGSHQDAIAKGMQWRKEHNPPFWSVPYLPIDPKDIGKQYDGDIIRINSQSGKGGIGFILDKKFGLNLPYEFREIFGYKVKDISDNLHKELSHKEIYDIFMSGYVNIDSPLRFIDYKMTEIKDFNAEVYIIYKNKKMTVHGHGNGRLDAISNAIKNTLGFEYDISKYTGHALEKGSTSRAISYVGIKTSSNKKIFGAGIHTDIVTSSILALISALNIFLKG